MDDFGGICLLKLLVHQPRTSQLSRLNGLDLKDQVLTISTLVVCPYANTGRPSTPPATRSTRFLCLRPLRSAVLPYRKPCRTPKIPLALTQPLENQKEKAPVGLEQTTFPSAVECTTDVLQGQKDDHSWTRTNNLRQRLALRPPAETRGPTVVRFLVRPTAST